MDGQQLSPVINERESGIYNEPSSPMRKDNDGIDEYLTPNETPTEELDQIKLKVDLSLKKHHANPNLYTKNSPALFFKKMNGHRQDSGISSDGETVSPRSTASTSIGGSTEGQFQYDYAEQLAPHMYEELPGLRPSTYLTPTSSVKVTNDVTSSSGTDTTTDSKSYIAADDRTAIMKSDSTTRKRVNPLYETVAQSVNSVYSKKLQTNQDAHMQRHFRCLKILIVLVFVFSLCALALSIYTLLNIVAMKGDTSLADSNEILKNELHQLKEKLSQLELVMEVSGLNTSSEKLDQIMYRVGALEVNLDSEVKNLNKDVTHIREEVNETIVSVDTFGANFTKKLDDYRVTVDKQLNEISKTPGPQGPAGVGNLTACYQKTYNKNEVGGSNPSTPTWQPPEDLLADAVVMFASCYTANGDRTALMRKVLDSHRLQYNCNCYGGTGSWRECSTHLWLCPRISDPNSTNNG